MIRTLTIAAVLLSLVGALTYAAATASVRWWRSDVGRQAALTCGVYVFTMSLTAGRVAGWTYPTWVGLVTWIGIASMICGQAWLSLRLRVTGRRSRLALRRRGMR